MSLRRTDHAPSAGEPADIAAEQVQGDVMRVPAIADGGGVPVVGFKLTQQAEQGGALSREEVDGRDGRQGHGDAAARARVP